jgi:hypothetical protein
VQRAVAATWRGVGAILLAAVTLLGAGRAHGQAQNTGSILGSVTDPGGALIPGATVVAVEPDKGINRTVTSSKSGEYLLPSLPVGTYILTVTADGFETFVASNITVDADKSQKIVVQMTLGNAKETVTVDGEGTALDTNSATLGTLIDNKLVEELPIDGRNVVALAGLLPGVTDLNAPATNTSDKGGPTFSVSGSRNTQNLMLFDGLMWNNLFYNTGINYPPPNALQEISVQLLDFKAQYGRNAGAVFNVVTKSGTNSIHGAVWDYFQNQYFNASDYITKRNPEDNSNQFGFTVEGPIKRDKVFFAGTFQNLIQHLSAVGITPTQNPAARGLLADGVTPRPCTTPVYGASDSCAQFLGDVFPSGATSYGKFYNPIINSSSSGLQAQPSDAIAMFTSAAGQAGLSTANPPCLNQLQNAANYAATHPYLDGKLQASYLPNAEVPSECLNPVVAKFLNKYVPFPATTQSANGLYNNISAAPQPRNDKNLLVRIDWVATQRHKIDARYNLIDANDATASGVTSASVGIATYALSANHSISNFGNIGDAWVISPNLLNVFRAGYKRYTLLTPPRDHSTWNDFGGNFIEAGVPTLPVLNFSNFYALGAVSQANASVVNENIELLEQLSWTRGAHSFQFGANFLRLQYLNRTDYPGKLSFSSTFTGYADSDGAMGLLTSVQANSSLVQGGINHSIFGYMQDDWRATPKLTFNLGVRYELPFQWYQPNGYSSTFIPGHQSTVFPGAVGGLAFPGDHGVLKSLVPTDFNGVVPRIGLAYDVFGTGKFAIRAGFGMFFDAINANVIGVGEPFYFQFLKNLPSGGASVPLAQFGTNYADTRPNGNVLNIPTGFDKNNPQFIPPYTLFYPDRNFRTPYYEEMNVGFQYRVTRGGVLDVNYVGKMGRKLTVPFDQNPAIVDCSGGYYKANPQLYASPYCSYLVPGATNGTASSTTQSTNARLRYTPFSTGGQGLVDFASIGTSSYNGIQAQYTQRGGKLLTLLMSYAYSKNLDIQTQSETTSNSIPNVFDINSDHGPADLDVRHVLNMGWVLTLPRSTADSAIARAILNDWNFGGIFRAHTGRPYDVTINNDSALDGEPNQRAALVPGVSPYLPKNRHRTAKLAEYFNVDAFTYPTIGTFSNQSRNSFYGPGYLQTDMTLQRYFPLTHIHEGMRMLFRAEAFNVWNTPNLANPKAGFSCTTTSIQQPGNVNFGLPCRSNLPSGGPGSVSSTFGIIQSTYGNNANTSTNGRKMQFAMTVYF